jgi:hypothetical protein
LLGDIEKLSDGDILALELSDGLIEGEILGLIEELTDGDMLGLNDDEGDRLGD